MPFPEVMRHQQDLREKEAKKNAIEEARQAPLYQMPLEKLERLAKEESAREEVRAYQERIVAWAHRRPCYVVTPANNQLLLDTVFEFLEQSGRGDQKPSDFDLDCAVDAHGPLGSGRLELRRDLYTGRLTPPSSTLTTEQLREANLGHDPREWTL